MSEAKASGSPVRMGLVGRKVGMTRIFTDDGETVPVTVLDVSNNRVAQVKTAETDGYHAVQVAYGTRRASRIAKPVAGHLAKLGVEAAAGLREFRVDAAKRPSSRPESPFRSRSSRSARKSTSPA